MTNENDFDHGVQEEVQQCSYCSENRQFNMKWFTCVSFAQKKFQNMKTTREILGHGNYKGNKSKLNNEMKISSTLCRHTVCQKHFVITYQNCNNTEE